MNLKLFVNYYTQQNEWMYVNTINSDGTVKKTKMQPGIEGYWTINMEVEPTKDNYVDYYYMVMNGELEVRHEWEMITHRVEMVGDYNLYTSRDRWYDIPDDSYLYSSAYTKCIHSKISGLSPFEDCEKVLRLKVRAPQLHKDEVLMLVGDDEALGSWDKEKSVVMFQHEDNEWVATVDASLIKKPIVECKFIAVNIEDPKKDIIWEDGENRSLIVPDIKKNEVVIVEMARATFSYHEEKFAGTAVPVFSLRSMGSFGVGDFGDLKLMIDWVAKTGQRVLQVLPINDTTITHTWTDSYPYSCISIFALHPMYVDIRQLPALKDDAKAKEFEKERMELNALSQIDYERMTKAKNAYLRLVFEQEGKAVMASDDFKAWFKEEEKWLVPYAQYSILRDENGTPDYTQWKDHNVWDEADRKTLTNVRSKAYKEASYYYFVQYVLATQMKGAHEYARKNNVVLKGDIPIGVNRYGCDAWMEPRYFNLNGQAGAPPDDFSVNGQNWGFPTYNWEEMLKDDCLWWVRRFSNMSKYFDAYRIDHVLGFFRIWEIPIHSVHGLLGQFSPAIGMTPGEIESYGLKWNEEFMTTPFIMDWVIERMFPGKEDYVKETFLEKKDEALYRMKPEFDTQRKVEAYFEQLTVNNEQLTVNNEVMTVEELTAMRDSLYSLISNVLFLRDHRKEGIYHPRISSQYYTCYETLWDNDKNAYNNLYNDYFYRRNNQFWYLEAMKKLPRLVNATQMLVCAEDLGMVPDCVAWVMNELRILSLEIQSMPKDPAYKFGRLSHNPYRSVCTISSHDTATMRMWWDEDEARTQEYYRDVLRRGDAAPHPMPTWLAQDIIYRHLACPSMLCILTLQDWLAMSDKLRLADANAERINIPANPKHYWRYRMHLNLEDLVNADDFNSLLKDIIYDTNRKG